MTLPKGELFVVGESSRPSFVEQWSIQRKVMEFVAWLQDNFEPAGERMYLFSEYENEEELEEAVAELDEDVGVILKRTWGHLLSVHEFDEMLEVLYKEHPKEWQPSEERISVDEFEEDDEEELTMEALLRQLPRIRYQLETIEKNIHSKFGHNRPPEEFGLTAEEIRQAKGIVELAENLSPDELEDEKTKLRRLAVLCVKIGKACIGYMSQKGDVFIEGFVQAAGPEAGKWTARGIALFLAGEGVRTFGEALIKVLN